MATIGNRRNNRKRLLQRNHVFFTIDHVDITSIGDFYYFCFISVSVVIFSHILDTFEWLFLNYMFVQVSSISPYTASPTRPARYVFRWPPVVDGRIYICQLSPAYFQVFSRDWPTYVCSSFPGAIGGRFMNPNGI